MSDVNVKQAQKALDIAISSSKSTSANKLGKAGQAGDFIVRTAQEVESAHTLYNQDATVIQQFASDQMVVDLMKKNMSGFYGQAKQVMDALDVLQQVHPFVGVAVLAIKGVVSLELKRRENDRTVVLMLVKAFEMMNVLLQLKDTKDPDIVGPRGTIRGRLDSVLDNIKKNIVDCGNAIDKYYKSKFIVKFFRSSHWAGEFLVISGSFSQRIQELRDALIIRTALGTDIVIKKLEELTQKLNEREARFAKGVQMRGGTDEYFENERERRFAKEVHMRGGMDPRFESEDKLAELAKFAKEQEARSQNQVQSAAPSKDVNRPPSQTTSANESVADQYRLDASLLHELRSPLSSLLDENRALFMFKLKAQTSIIQGAIKDSETRIIWALNSKFRRVKDLHLQYIWKEMKWTTSVKTLYFMAELHDYYTNRFSRLDHDAPRPQATSGTSSLVARVPSPTPTATSDSEGEALSTVDPADHTEPPPIDPADKWCLKYLTVFYIPSLSESFDGDANGLVSVREINAFTSAIPSGWSLPQALAYWAAGWRVDSQYYHARIEQVLNSMVYAQEDVLPANRRCTALYLDSNFMDGLKGLVRSLAELGSEDSDLDLAELTARRRNAQEEILTDKLSAVKYEIDSKDSIKLFGSGRIENFLLPVLYLVTRRHLQIMRLARTVILVDRELESATQTIANILEAVDLRVEELAESFRQQGNDPKVRFTWYAHGLYNFWYNPERSTDDYEYWGAHDFGLDDTELEIDAAALKFGPLSLTEDQDLLDRPVKLVPSNSNQQLEDPKDEYIRLWCMNKLHNEGSSYPFEMPSYLSPEEQQRFKFLSEDLPDSDIQRCSLLAELQIRKRLFGCYCNACHSFIADVYHRCIDCEYDTYDLCVECESLPGLNHKYQSDHKATHNVLLFRMVLPYDRCTRVRRYARKFLYTFLPAAAPPEAPLTPREDESQTQSDEPELLHPTEATQAEEPQTQSDEHELPHPTEVIQADEPTTQSNEHELPHPTEAIQADPSASVDLQEGDEKLDKNPGAAFGEIARTSVATGDAYACAECGVKMKGIFYVCLTCAELHTAIALCGGCAFSDAFNVVTEHHPYKHWLVKIKDRVQDVSIGTSDEPLDNVDETTSLSLRIDKLAAMVESRFVEQDLRLSALVTQIDQLVHSLAALTGKAELPAESVTV